MAWRWRARRVGWSAIAVSAHGTHGVCTSVWALYVAVVLVWFLGARTYVRGDSLMSEEGTESDGDAKLSFLRVLV